MVGATVALISIEAKLITGRKKIILILYLMKHPMRMMMVGMILTVANMSECIRFDAIFLSFLFRFFISSIFNQTVKGNPENWTFYEKLSLKTINTI